ncbi:alpha-glucan family phosphorylase [Paenibacillus sp. MMS18-CY102]|uniref:alpha-glucan family phosphorylase n=1 Tax=Paenibacillus sp. MMS18-CY102 TaxID=2682849 RepID=UPI001365AEC6|nr:alpha-glucan family phosphorylase [Paenibacillus sp. MMS18-CY102]MWC29606.1 alpha-glucan family phosphorylase [Paenibacillus sp. MMS18-CY102]
MPNRGVAYFSAEFGLDESLPIYSGGLGILAGDHIKAAADLNIPLTGVGIFYKRGYFQQHISESGWQQQLYPEVDLAASIYPVQLVKDTEERPIIIAVEIAGRQVYASAWRVELGSVTLYLLSTDVEANSDADRHLTDTLYPSNQDVRISQEMILGIGGVKLLAALGIQPDVWHMNEGHSAFLAFERIRMLSAEGVPFETALEAAKANAVFTTHTPVPAGHDVFSIEMIDRYIGHYYWQMGASRERVLSLGELEGAFNMTRLAVRTSSKVNGVSKLHGEVTRELFHRWMPHIPIQDIPVDSVTNGVHAGTWLAEGIKQLYDTHLASGWAVRTQETQVWDAVRDIPADELWEMHQRAKSEMVRALGLNLPSLGEAPLVIGFARRFATYKRALLIFSDLERLARILGDPQRPVCLVFAGKAHPADEPGKDMIRRIVELSREERFKGRVHIVENYTMNKAKKLVQGVDVWLNTPVKPMEASGTSGQKAAMNGVLNCSVLDGWWVEGYNRRNGWAIDGVTNGDPGCQAQQDSETLYRLLEEEIIPLYYQRDEREIPAEWVDMMKESICSLTPVYNTHRMVSDYWHQVYAPAAARGSRFAADNFEIASRVSAYKQFIRANWPSVQVRSVEILGEHSGRIGLNKSTFRAEIALGTIWHKDVHVEAVGSDGRLGIWKAKLEPVQQLAAGTYVYEGVMADVPIDIREANVNVRVTPISPDFANEFEMELAVWG